VEYHVDLTGTNLQTLAALKAVVPEGEFDVVGQEGDRLLSVQTSSYYARLLEQNYGAKATSLDELRRNAPSIV